MQKKRLRRITLGNNTRLVTIGTTHTCLMFSRSTQIALAHAQFQAGAQLQGYWFSTGTKFHGLFAPYRFTAPSILHSMRTHFFFRSAAWFGIASLLVNPLAYGWGSVGHRMINRLAESALPSSMPAFLRTPSALDEVEYLGPEPDRWRSPTEPELSHAQAPEHFLDMEYLDQLGPLPHQRLDFEKDALAHGLDPAHVGLQPWQTDEVWERLKASFRAYRELSAKHQDTAAVQQAILFYIGWLGHYVGDGSQPLHTTINYDGWALAANPNHFSREHGIHSLFESQFVGSQGANLHPSDVADKMTPPHLLQGDIFTVYMDYLHATSGFIQPLYLLNKTGAFEGKGTQESRSFVEQRLAAGASMLRDMIYTAWVRSADPVPQRSYLAGE